MEHTEERKIRARSMLSAKDYIRQSSGIAEQRAGYRYGNRPSIRKKTGKLNNATINEVVNTNNPNSPINRSRTLGE